MTAALGGTRTRRPRSRRPAAPCAVAAPPVPSRPERREGRRRRGRKQITGVRFARGVCARRDGRREEREPRERAAVATEDAKRENRASARRARNVVDSAQSRMISWASPVRDAPPPTTASSSTGPTAPPRPSHDRQHHHGKALGVGAARVTLVLCVRSLWTATLPGPPAAALSPTLSLLEVGLQLAQTASPRRTSDSRGVAHGLRRALHALRLGQNRRFWLDVSTIRGKCIFMGDEAPRSPAAAVRRPHTACDARCTRCGWVRVGESCYVSPRFAENVSLLAK